ncbi:hypothetical protein [Citrobacter youngae]|uniref:hypothetical protein n=1 Tax=Citrobacter youngae TaxID=133448 RepID=UPI003EDED805
MTALNKQALTTESARESGNILLIVAARMARRELFTPLHFVSELPQKVVSMRVFREALERSEETLQREVCKIVDGHDRMAKKLKEAEAKLEAAEKRIAELEARGITVEPFRSFVTDDDLAALHRFAECCDDPESGGHDLEKEQVRRLEAIGALQRSGRICYITGFGDVLISITAGIGVKGV